VRRSRSLTIGSCLVQIVGRCRERAVRTAARCVRSPVDFADERRSYTQAFEQYVLELSQRMTIRGMAEHLQVSWDLVRDIQYLYLRRRFRRIELTHLRQIAIDDIAVGRGHRYLTVVLDLDPGRKCS
jgi:transposase